MNDQIMEILRVLAEKFGTTTEFLWGVMIRQTCHKKYVVFVTDLRRTMFAIFMCRLGGLLFSFIWVCFFLSGMFEVATALINPEYWVIQQVLKGLK